MNDKKLTFQFFIKKYSNHLLIMEALLVMAMYRYLFSTNHRIDTIIKIVSTVDEFNDIELGRFGIVYLNRLLGMQWLNPYLIAFLTMVTIMLTSAMLVFILWKITYGRHDIVIFFVPGLIFLTPNWTEQLYFSYQTFLVLLGTLLTVHAAYLALQWTYRMEKKLLVIAAALLFVAFSIYQSFVPLYMAMCFGMFLLDCVSDRKKELSYFARTVVANAIVGGIALVSYYLVNKLANINAVQTDYLSKQVLWGNQPINGVVSSIVQSVSSIMLARGLVDTWVIPLALVASAVFLGVFLVKNRDVQMKGFILLAWLFLQLSGIALILVLGVRTYIRTELAATFVLALNFLLCYVTAVDSFNPETQKRKHRNWVILACFVGFLGLAMNGGMTFRLYYTDDIRNQRDQVLAQNLISDLVKNTTAKEQEKPVVFIGETQPMLDATCKESEVVGVSLFAYHDSCDATNTIIHDYLLANGLHMARPDADDIKLGWKLAKGMNDYPLDNSILETEDVIVVRLSEDPYEGTEYMEAGYEVSDQQPSNFVDTHITQIDNIICSDDVVTLQGFSLLRGTDARALHYEVLLVDRTTDNIYEVNTSCAQRLKVAKSYTEDGVKYDACGFVAKFPLALLDNETRSTYEIILHCTSDYGDDYYVKTDIYLNLSMVTKNPTLQ